MISSHLFSPSRQIQPADQKDCRSAVTQDFSRVTLFSPLRQIQPVDTVVRLILRIFRVLLCFQRCDRFNPPITYRRSTKSRHLPRYATNLACERSGSFPCSNCGNSSKPGEKNVLWTAVHRQKQRQLDIPAC